MPRTSPSPLHPQQKASSGHQTTSPRRSARIQKAASSSLLQAPIDRPSGTNPTESYSLNPPSAKDARQKQKAVGQALEGSSSIRHEQPTTKRHARTEDALQAVEFSSSPPSQQGSAKKRKRSEDAEASPPAQHQRVETRQNSAPPNIPHPSVPDSDQEEQSNDPVDYWRKHHVWPSNFFDSDGPAIMTSLTRSSSTKRKDRRNYSKEIWNFDVSDPGSDSPETRAYLLKLSSVDNFFKKHSRDPPPTEGLPIEAKKVIEILKTQEQTVPSFLTQETLQLIQSKIIGKNEAKVVSDVGPVVVPHVDHINYLENNILGKLTESVDDIWSHCIPILASNCPKPDYTAGFDWRTFNDNQIEKMDNLGPTADCSFYQGRKEQYFPFFTCEAKGTSGDISEAGNQSLETALIASRGLIELFRRAKLEDKIQHQILCFSAVYDNANSWIYAHLSHDVRERFPTFYRYQVACFNFPAQALASYKLVKNIYKIWAPQRRDLICEALDVIAKMPGLYIPSASSSATAPSPGAGGAAWESNRRSMNPPSAAPDRSGRGRSRNDSTPDTTPNPHPKKPKTSG
ncbi:hypothetical protein IWX49DRAFT_625256 [Phyllosticta citricarpa]|uniref:DUF7924 domain-containing protein n=2 Tax=Phyllosticta TaxID=121621 RepID=A0ABR1MGP9_9PEZI